MAEKEEIISDTSSLVFIAKLGIFNLAKNMFSKILVPEQVINELLASEWNGRLIIEKELDNFIYKTKLLKIKDIPVDFGERAAISLCLERKIKNFLSDDKNARRTAQAFGIEVKGVLGILFWNLKHGNINKKECKKFIENLIDKGYYISDKLYQKSLKLIEFTDNS